MSFFRRKKSIISHEIDPDEIFLDSKNLPDFDVNQFEGRIEKPISIVSILGFSVILLVLIVILLSKVWLLQVKNGASYKAMSENNMLEETIIFPERGAITDRNGIKLAWNTINPNNTSFSTRVYIKDPGFSHVLGYVKYPSKDSQGNYYRSNFEGVAGIEKYYNDLLAGSQGLKIVETDALGKVTAESIIRKAEDGQNLTLSIDANIEKKLYDSIKALANQVGFSGGGGIIINVHTGEVLALTSYPEYESQVMSDGKDSTLISEYLHDTNKPFLDRMLSGLYTPGSIVKPYVAIGALQENVISPLKQILSTGSISIPNPYDPKRQSVFMDWRPQGLVDMRKAIAVSSDVYFYEVGGGFQNQAGLGIDKLNKYFSIFGLGKKTDDGFFAGPAGTIPSPDWKDRVFPGDPWRIGDTYFTAIGQYGFQVTPLQMLKAITSVANGGTYIHPTIFKTSTSTVALGDVLPIDPANLKVVREGMREGVLIGTAVGLNVPYVDIAAKTGTAELGVSKSFVNSWATGFFPYENPKYAFIVMMEHGPSTNVFGGVFVIRQLFDWLHANYPDYLK